jgi:hypothetical protein
MIDQISMLKTGYPNTGFSRYKREDAKQFGCEVECPSGQEQQQASGNEQG